MPLPGTVTRDPSEDVVVLQMVASGAKLNKWKEYAFSQSFLKPTSSFHFVVSVDEISQSNRAALIPGAEVRLTVNGAIQGSGRIDRVTFSADRSAGSEIHIEGRDKLAQAVDSGIDPRHKFTAQMNLQQLLAEVFGPFGFTADQILIDNEDNRGAMAKNVTGTKTSKGAKHSGRDLKSFVLHQLRPYPHEHALEFAARICQRNGLWLWLSADGQNIIASQPDYDQQPIYLLRRRYNDQTNNFNGTVQLAMDEQPSIIVADGFSGGVEFGRARLRCIARNPALTADDSAVITAYANSGATSVSLPFTGAPYVSTVSRPLFLHDDDAKTPQQLEAFVLRELSLRVRKSLTVGAQVYGHEQNGNVWNVDTICRLDDDLSGVHEDLWVMERTFRKSRTGGTTSDLILIRKHSMVFDTDGS